jgi:cytidyltransferase-like protein
MCAGLCVILENNIEKMKPKAIIVSGYFNPIHKGHIEYFQNAKTNGDKLFVIVNSDFQRALKGSKEFQDENERVFIVESLRLVDKCFLSIDKDRTVVESIKMIFNQYGNEFQLAFANGGDQNNDTIPERPISEELGIELIDGMGGKIQSSSWLLNKL